MTKPTTAQLSISDDLEQRFKDSITVSKIALNYDLGIANDAYFIATTIHHALRTLDRDGETYIDVAQSVEIAARSRLIDLIDALRAKVAA